MLHIQLNMNNLNNDNGDFFVSIEILSHVCLTVIPSQEFMLYETARGLNIKASSIFTGGIESSVSFIESVTSNLNQFKMNTLLCVSVVIAIFVATVSAYPSFDTETSVVEKEDALWVRIPKTLITTSDIETEQHHEVVPLEQIRSRRSPKDDRTKIYAEGNHDRRGGSNIYVQGQHRLWQSQDKMNEIHANGQFGQHFGGPGGRSPPSYGGGLSYTRHF